MKELILSNVRDLVSDFLYYDRKEDEDLSSEDIGAAIGSGEVTIEELVEAFRKELKKQIEE